METRSCMSWIKANEVVKAGHMDYLVRFKSIKSITGERKKARKRSCSDPPPATYTGTGIFFSQIFLNVFFITIF